jgi:hypothetical protein
MVKCESLSRIMLGHLSISSRRFPGIVDAAKVIEAYVGVVLFKRDCGGA